MTNDLDTIVRKNYTRERIRQNARNLTEQDIAVGMLLKCFRDDRTDL